MASIWSSLCNEPCWRSVLTTEQAFPQRPHSRVDAGGKVWQIPFKDEQFFCRNHEIVYIIFEGSVCPIFKDVV